MILASDSPVGLLLSAAAALAYAVPALGARALGGLGARRVLLMAWVLTLPAAIALSGSLYWLFAQVL